MVYEKTTSGRARDARQELHNPERDGWPTQCGVRCAGYFGFRLDHSNPLKPTAGLNGPPALRELLNSRVLTDEHG
jgi:hypothetical protein